MNRNAVDPLADRPHGAAQPADAAAGSLAVPMPDRFALAAPGARAQRVLDVAIALPALTVFGAVLPLLALVITLDSPGPVFYRQERIGQNRRRRGGGEAGRRTNRRKAVMPGRPFLMWKLRTMRTDAERHGPALAVKGDARVTRVGRFLRRTRLDEVPQFLNVLRGEMSVVGPRPERLCFISRFEQNVPRYRDRLLVRPGITGLAQVENGYDTGLDSVRRKVKLDCAYIERASVRTDLDILRRTVRVVLKGTGAL